MVGGRSLLTEPAASSFERSGVDDGTFWQEYTHFLMGFSHVDVCFALRGWHARTLTNRFPADKRAPHRLCECMHVIRCAEPTTVFVLALQPTRRGAWCRADRKKTYRLGDLSVLIVRLTPGGGAVERLVGGGLRGADRGERTFAARLDTPGATCAVPPPCLGA